MLMMKDCQVCQSPLAIYDPWFSDRYEWSISLLQSDFPGRDRLGLSLYYSDSSPDIYEAQNTGGASPIFRIFHLRSFQVSVPEGGNSLLIKLPEAQSCLLLKHFGNKVSFYFKDNIVYWCNYFIVMLFLFVRCLYYLPGSGFLDQVEPGLL